MTAGEATLRQVVLGSDPDAVEVNGAEPLLLGLAAWAAAASAGSGGVLVGGVEPVQASVRVLDSHGEQFVLAATRVMTVVAVADPGGGRGIDAPGRTLLCSGAPRAVAAGLEVLSRRGGDLGEVELDLMRAAVRGAEATSVLPLLAGLESAIRADRRSIATWIHDGPVQELTAAQLLIDSATWGADLPAAVGEPLTEGVASLRAAVGGCRRLMSWLSVPPVHPVEDP